MTVLQSGEFLAPDGIIIRPVSGVNSDLSSIVMGRILPREDDYSVHLHYGLEQVTYVISGQVTVLQRTPADGQHTQVKLGPGEAITTPPASTLSFRNHGAEVADVLFICIPPYPPTNSDTELLSSGHRGLTAQELRTSVERLRRAQEYIAAQLDARLQAIRWLAHVDDSDKHRG